MSSSPLAASPEADSDRALLFLSVALGLYGVATLYAMAAMNLGAALVAVAFVVACRGPRGAFRAIRAYWSRFPYRRFAGWTLALLAACVLSLAVASVAPPKLAEIHVDAANWRELGRIWHLLVPLVLAPALERVGPSRRATIFWLWIGMFVVMGAIGVQQYFTGWPFRQPIPNHPPYFHASLRLGHHLTVASCFIFPFFVALDLLRRAQGGLRALLALGIVLGAVTLFFTYSRMLWIALPLGLLVWGWLALPRRVAIAGILTLVLGASALVMRPEVRARATSPMGISEREAFWHAHATFFQERPITGTGLFFDREFVLSFLNANYPQFSWIGSAHAHNNLLEMAGGTGLIGLLAWLGYCGWILARGWRMTRLNEGAWGAGFFAAWVTFHLNGLTQVNFWDSRVLHVMMWTVAWMLVAPLSAPRLKEATLS